MIVVPCYAAPKEVGFGVLITVAGIPVYFFGVLWQNKPKSVQNAIGKVIRLCFIVQAYVFNGSVSFSLFSIAGRVTEVCQKFLVSAKEECD